MAGGRCNGAMMGLDILEFMVQVEKETGLHIADGDMADLTTARKVIHYLLEKSRDQPVADRRQRLSAHPWSADRMEELVCRLIRENFGVVNFSLDDRFREDMGVH